MRQTKLSPIGVNTFGIYIDSCNDEGIRGRLAGGPAENVIEFSSLSRMILLMDSLLDAAEAGRENPPPELPGNPTLEVEILFRQNCSWQGRLRWPKEGKEAAFRSVLELIVLIETILAQ